MGCTMTKIYEMKRSGKAFLVIEEPVFSSLTEERMLIKAEAGCFLRPRRIFEQEKAGLCYDVSGLQSLRLFCEGRRNCRALETMSIVNYRLAQTVLFCFARGKKQL